MAKNGKGKKKNILMKTYYMKEFIEKEKLLWEKNIILLIKK